MNNSNDKSDKDEQMDNKKMNELQDQLDIAVFEQEEMDVDKVKEILDKMENISPDQEKKGFDKENLWKRIEEQSREEFAEEQILEFDRIKAGKKRKGASIGASGAGRGVFAEGRGSNIRKIAAMAAIVVLAVFVGANIGTYATEKQSVFAYVSDLKNGTTFWITGDAPSMEFVEEVEVYYSWNDVPNEYKEFLIIPQGLPEDMELYDINISVQDIYEKIVVRYLDENATCDFSIQIVKYNDDEFSFANSIYKNDYVKVEQRNIKEIDTYFCVNENDEISVQFFYNKCVYTFGGTMTNDALGDIVEETIECNF